MTVLENAATKPTNPSTSGHARGRHARWFNLFRVAVAAILLLPAIWFSWKTADGLVARRVMRTDLAEIENARYGILSADKWRAIIGPMLNAQIDKLDFKGQGKSLAAHGAKGAERAAGQNRRRTSPAGSKACSWAR